jgi:hypothetical protein
MKNKKAQIITNQQFSVMVIFIILLVLIFGNEWFASKLIFFLISLFILNPVLSLFTDSLIDSLGFEFLKNISLSKEICGFNFSITAYALVSIILGLILFG